MLHVFCELISSFKENILPPQLTGLVWYCGRNCENGEGGLPFKRPRVCIVQKGRETEIQDGARYFL